MGARGLLDRLQSRTPSPIDEVASITEHLRVLLNARQGASESAPRYGVIDFNSIMHNVPETLGALQQAIRSTITEYEPRLERVFVQHVEGDQALLLRFDVRARVRRSRSLIRLHTSIHAGGHFTVE